MERLLSAGASPEPEEVVEVNELEELRAELAELREDLTKFCSAFERDRSQLGNMLHALRSIFSGGATEAGPQQPSAATQDNVPRTSRIWQTWIQKLGGRRAEFIQALLDHGAMTSTQLEIAAHCPHGSVAGVIYELKRLNLIVKNGDRYSLKEL